MVFFAKNGNRNVSGTVRNFRESQKMSKKNLNNLRTDYSIQLTVIVSYSTNILMQYFFYQRQVPRRWHQSN